MLTKKLSNPASALIAGLAVGLLSQAAAATEEVVVYGGKTALEALRQEAALQSQMKEYTQSLNEDFKATLEKELRNRPAPKIEIAASETPTRG